MDESLIIIADTSTPKRGVPKEEKEREGLESADDLLPQRTKRNTPIGTPKPKSVIKADIQSPRISKLKTEVKSEIKVEIKGEIKAEIKGETSRTPVKKTQGAAISAEKKKWNPSASYSYSGERGAASKEPLSASQLPNGTPNCLEVILVCAMVYNLIDKYYYYYHYHYPYVI